MFICEDKFEEEWVNEFESKDFVFLLRDLDVKEDKFGGEVCERFDICDIIKNVLID